MIFYLEKKEKKEKSRNASFGVHSGCCISTILRFTENCCLKFIEPGVIFIFLKFSLRERGGRAVTNCEGRFWDMFQPNTQHIYF